jgi:hypothetical protein
MHTCKILYTIVELCIVGAKVWRIIFIFFLYMYQYIIVINNAGQQRSTIFSLVFLVCLYFKQQEDKI